MTGVNIRAASRAATRKRLALASDNIEAADARFHFFTLSLASTGVTHFYDVIGDYTFGFDIMTGKLICCNFTKK